jgi:hypothetical protein
MRIATWITSGILALALFGCGPSKGAPSEPEEAPPEPAAEAAEPVTPVDPSSVPDYLQGFGDLYVRVGDDIEDAPEEIEAVARRYPLYPHKGDLDGGVRLTILTAKETVKVGEEVVVIHVCEVTKPGIETYVMGPKRVHGEYVDGVLASAPWKGLGVYDGAVLSTPTADAHYDLTTYTWSTPGTHTIQWRHGGTTCDIAGVSPVSNTLTITVVE